MKRSQDRILTTHVGSLPRPDTLLELSSYGKGPPEDPEEYARRVRVAVAAIVKQQAQVGLDIINDGEFGKESWANYILKRITGFEIRPHELRPLEWLGRDRERFGEFIAEEMPHVLTGSPTEACVEAIRYKDTRAIDQAVDNLKTALRSVQVAEGFMTAVAPASTAYDGVNEFYPSERDYVFAIADALRVEYLAIHKAGLLVQVDDAVLANMYDALTQKGPERYREWAELRVEALNRALEGIPEERVRYHVCFGSWHVPHLSDAPLEDIVDLILKVRAGAYSIEAANPRHEHEWRVWEKVKLPPGKILIPGVITHHIVTVEHPRVVADRIVRFAQIVGRENVIAGTDCGFAQVDRIKRVHPKIMWAKFEALVEGARMATQELWGT
ncbi:MAG TPA: cobalamin-independent methionine synthase II family protein [Steroidobacteraceae bacterium]|nr:cobalamin-independent methionine synthase II family protein [Steroidobacteraceae bacterium]